MRRRDGGGRHRHAQDGGGLGRQERVVVQPCYQRLATIRVVVHGFSSVVVTAPVGANVEQVVNRATDAEGQDGRGRRVTVVARATRALVEARLALTCVGRPRTTGRYHGEEAGVGFRVKAGTWTVVATAGDLRAEGDVTVGEGAEATLHLWLGVVFARATFTRASARTLPDLTAGGLDWTAADDDGLVFTRSLVPPDNTGATWDARVVVDLGLGGGDRCVVGFGLEEAANTVTRTFTNWREIDYEIFTPLPTSDQRISHTRDPFFVDAEAPDFGGEISGRFATVLDPLFVRFRRCAGLHYTPDDLAAVGAARAVLPSDHFPGTEPDRLVTVLTETQASVLLTRMQGRAAVGDRDRAIRVSMVLCDYLTDRTSSATLNAVDVVGAHDIDVSHHVGIFPRMLANDFSSITELEWRVTHRYYNQAWTADRIDDLTGSLRDVSDEMKGAGTDQVTVGPRRVQVAFPLEDDDELFAAAPADGKIVLHEGRLVYCCAVNDPYDLENEMTAQRLARLEIGCGATTTVGDTRYALLSVRLALKITAEKRLFGRNAFAARGTACFALGDPDVGPAAWQGLTRTLLHELGHNMGQAYGRPGLDTWGRDEATEIPGVPFPASVPEGTAYELHDHVGPHCAAHLSREQREELSYRQFSLLGGRCIMWGDGNILSTDQPDYCVACKKHIQADDLTSIIRKWAPNGPG